MLDNDYMTWMYGFVTVLLIIVWYAVRCFVAFVREGFESSKKAQKEILSNLQTIIQQRTDCLLSLPERFADKKETKDNIEKLHHAIDEHDDRLDFLEKVYTQDTIENKRR